MESCVKDILLAYPFPLDEDICVAETLQTYARIKITDDVQRCGGYGFSFSVCAKPVEDRPEYVMWNERFWSDGIERDLLTPFDMNWEQMCSILDASVEFLNSLQVCPYCGHRSVIPDHYGAKFCTRCPKVLEIHAEKVGAADPSKNLLNV